MAQAVVRLVHLDTQAVMAVIKIVRTAIHHAERGILAVIIMAQQIHVLRRHIQLHIVVGMRILAQQHQAVLQRHITVILPLHLIHALNKDMILLAGLYQIQVRQM
jgi:hypothetical protein